MRLDQLSDEELMVMYQNGSEEAFKSLYGRHSEKIYGFLRGRVWNEERAAELYQEVFLKIHRSKHLYNKLFPTLPWIFSITRSVLIDGLRSDKKISSANQNDITEAVPVHENRTNADLTGLLSRLPENQRRAIELRYVDEKTFEDIAETLDTTSGNARKIISRAVANLKAFAGQKGD